MAHMGFCDKHNMVAFLQKPSGSEEFHQIVDFLAGSHIRYALTANPTIYVSLVEQFWQTATVETLNDGEQQITVTVDGHKFAITEASVRRHLQLADVDGISSLPNTEIFEQLSLMGGGKKPNQDQLLDGFEILMPDVRLWHGPREQKEVVKEGRQSNETEELNLDADTEVIVEDKGSGEKGVAQLVLLGQILILLGQKLILLVHQKGILVEEEPVKIKRKDQGIDQIKRDEELAHKLHEEELAEIARIQEEKAAQEEPSRTAIMEMIDEVQAEYGVTNTLHLKTKTFEEIQGMYKRQKKKIDDFKPMDSDDAVKDSKKAAGEDTSKKKEVLKEPDSTKVEIKLEEAEQGTKKTLGKIVKMKARKKARKQTHADTDNEHDSEEDERKIESITRTDQEKAVKKFQMFQRREKETFLKIVPDKEGIIDYKVLEKRFPIINWESKFYHYDIHRAEGIYYRIFRSDGSSRRIKTFSKMVTRFDRLDLMELYNKGDVERKDELWQNQEDGILKRLKFMRIMGSYFDTRKMD
ncbi:hypothetical protein Tco_0676181 [Tanacetum coccineum]